MEDYKFLIYIALSILYFLFKGSKKKPVTRKNPQRDVETAAPKEGKSFEDIIRELSGDDRSVQQEEIEFEAAKPLRDQVDKRLLNQEVDEEDFENADETLKELYKKGERLKSINELVDLNEVEKTSSRFQEFDIEPEENTFAREIREGLSDPHNAKKAIIYAEIFNRKY